MQKYLKYILLKILIYLLLILHTSIAIFQIIFLLGTKKYILFIKFAPILFGFFLGITTMYIAVAYYKRAEKLRLNVNLVSLEYNAVGDDFQKYVLNKAKLLKIVILFHGLVGVTSGISLLPIFGFEYEMYFAIYIIRLYSGVYSNYLIWVYFISCFGLVYCMIFQINIILYFERNIVLQARIITQYIQNISTDFDTLNYNDLFYDESYHKIIQQRLKFCIKRYWRIKNSAMECQKAMFWPIIHYMCGVILFVISIIFYIYTTMTSRDIPRIICISAVSIGSLIIVSNCGQCITDQFQKIFHSLVETRWFTWNKENKKLLLLLMMSAGNAVVISVANIIVMDHSLILKIVKMVYPAAAVLRLMSNTYQK